MNKHDPEDPFDSFWGFKRKRFNGGASWAAWTPPPPPKPEPVYIQKDEWPTPKPRTQWIFAKSCTPCNRDRTDVGTTTEPASNFGMVMPAGSRWCLQVYGLLGLLTGIMAISMEQSRYTVNRASSR